MTPDRVQKQKTFNLQELLLCCLVSGFFRKVSVGGLTRIPVTWQFEIWSNVWPLKLSHGSLGRSITVKDSYGIKTGGGGEAKIEAEKNHLEKLSLCKDLLMLVQKNPAEQVFFGSAFCLPWHLNASPFQRHKSSVSVAGVGPALQGKTRNAKGGTARSELLVSTMQSTGMQILGISLAILGWVGVIITCALPMWKVSAFTGVNIVTAHIIWEGIWMSCVVQNSGQTECKAYDSMLALSSDLQAARALICIAMVTGTAGLILTAVGGKCTNIVAGSSLKGKASKLASLVLIATGLLCLVPVSWTASSITKDFYNPMLTDAQRRELGASLYIGWGASILFILGGVLLSNPCALKNEESLSGKYLIVRSSSGTSRVVSVRSRSVSQKSSIPMKTYL
nr:claudin-4-like [Paramormyrops kingsleyae]